MPAPSRPVTERDFRRPEFLTADPADYEFRQDGAIVRKDRWEIGIYDIRAVLLGAQKIEDAEEFEIPDLVAAVSALCSNTPTPAPAPAAAAPAPAAATAVVPPDLAALRKALRLLELPRLNEDEPLEPRLWEVVYALARKSDAVAA